MSGGYSGTPLTRKLGVKEDHRVALLWAPDHLEGIFGVLPRGVRLSRRPRADASYEVVVAFVTSESELIRAFDRGRSLMDVDGGLWICWPKQSSPLATDLREGHVRAHGLGRGLVDNKVCAVDPDWSGLRFVIRVADRGHARRG